MKQYHTVTYDFSQDLIKKLINFLCTIMMDDVDDDNDEC